MESSTTCSCTPKLSSQTRSEDLGLRQHPTGVAHEQAQYLELCRGEIDRVTPTPDLMRVLVHGQVRDRESVIAVVGPSQPGSAEQPAEPSDHLFEAERLGHVVVGASGNARNPVRGRIAG